MKGLVPTPVEIGRETLTILAGALVAAYIIGHLPAVRDWMRRQWGSAPMPTP